MTDTTHDPPAPGALRGFSLHELDQDLPVDRLALLSGPNFEKHVLMRDRLGVEPLAVVALMKRGGYRFKSVRGKPGVLVMRRGSPVPDTMSFRQIAPILTEMSGVPVTYETVRRWWEIVFPDDPATEPEDEPTPVKRTVRRRTPAAPPVSDEHADAIRAAVERTKATTNPDVPSAVFLPPAE